MCDVSDYAARPFRHASKELCQKLSHDPFVLPRLVVEQVGEDAVGFGPNWNEALRAFQLVRREITEAEDESAIGLKADGGGADQRRDGFEGGQVHERVAHADDECGVAGEVRAEIPQVILHSADSALAGVFAQLGEQRFAEVEGDDRVASLDKRDCLKTRATA
jgi:hypothetical protein